MTFQELVQTRYSCKKYDPTRTPTEDQLNAILKAGQAAPTAKNLQGQRIYVLRSPEALAMVDTLTPCRYGAPVVLAVCYDDREMFTYPGGEQNSGLEDATIVATHMILAAADAGVDSCWLNFFDPAKAAEALKLPSCEHVVMLMDLGFAAEGAGPLPNHGSRKPLEETVRYL